MNAADALFTSGIVLLATSALCGFVQHRFRKEPEEFAAWRVVHNGGTAGAVQLIALAEAWKRFGGHGVAPFVAVGLIVATLAFFLGPLARATHRPLLARIFLGAGAVVGAPAYLALPVAAFS